MRKLIVLWLVVVLFSLPSFGQEETRHHSSGPRRQLATIVFAGLGGAILGLSTLSFYGRPQDQLSNIAIGFVVGVIAGTAYVTIRSATSRDYYDEKPPQSILGVPPENLVSPEVAQQLNREVRSADFEDDQTQKVQLLYAPLIAKTTEGTTAFGGQFGIQF